MTLAANLKSSIKKKYKTYKSDLAKKVKEEKEIRAEISKIQQKEKRHRRIEVASTAAKYETSRAIKQAKKGSSAQTQKLQDFMGGLSMPSSGGKSSYDPITGKSLIKKGRRKKRKSKGKSITINF